MSLLLRSFSVSPSTIVRTIDLGKNVRQLAIVFRYFSQHGSSNVFFYKSNSGYEVTIQKTGEINIATKGHQALLLFNTDTCRVIQINGVCVSFFEDKLQTGDRILCEIGKKTSILTLN